MTRNLGDVGLVSFLFMRARNISIFSALRLGLMARILGDIGLVSFLLMWARNVSFLFILPSD